MKQLIFILSFFALFLSTEILFAQCPMCRTAVESAMEGGSTVGLGLNAGILYLLLMPYLMFTTIFFFWYRSYKKKKRLEAAESF